MGIVACGAGKWDMRGSLAKSIGRGIRRTRVTPKLTSMSSMAAHAAAYRAREDRATQNAAARTAAISTPSHKE